MLKACNIHYASHYGVPIFSQQTIFNIHETFSYFVAHYTAQNVAQGFNVGVFIDTKGIP
jgi:hypothetical protein